MTPNNSIEVEGLSRQFKNGPLAVDRIDLRVEPDSPDDQSRTLQRAIEQTAAARVPLMLPPGVYRAGDLTLPTGTRLIGCPGATRLLFTEGASLLSAKDADHVTLTGLILDGGTRPLAGRGMMCASSKLIIASRCVSIAAVILDPMSCCLARCYPRARSRRPP